MFLNVVLYLIAGGLFYFASFMIKHWRNSKQTDQFMLTAHPPQFQLKELILVVLFWPLFVAAYILMFVFNIVRFLGGI